MNDDRLMSSEKAGSYASSGESQEAIQYTLQNPKEQKDRLPGEPMKMASESDAKKTTRILIANLLQKQLDFQHPTHCLHYLVK